MYLWFASKSQRPPPLDSSFLHGALAMKLLAKARYDRAIVAHLVAGGVHLEFIEIIKSCCEYLELHRCQRMLRKQTVA